MSSKTYICVPYFWLPCRFRTKYHTCYNITIYNLWKFIKLYLSTCLLCKRSIWTVTVLVMYLVEITFCCFVVHTCKQLLFKVCAKINVFYNTTDQHLELLCYRIIRIMNATCVKRLEGDFHGKYSK